MKEVDYLEMTASLLDEVGKLTGESDDTELLYSSLKECSGEIKTLSELLKTTGLYKDSLPDSEAFYRDFIEVKYKTNKEKVIGCWLHFLDRVCESPTRTHMRGVVILCIPLLENCLNLPEEL